MKKLNALVMGSALVLLAGCGGAENDTSMEAAKTFMTAMVDGDMQLMSEVNHSSEMLFPADQMIKIANRDGVVGLDVSDMEFEQIDDLTVDVTFTTSDGEDGYTLVFNEEKEGYYFIGLD